MGLFTLLCQQGCSRKHGSSCFSNVSTYTFHGIWALESPCRRSRVRASQQSACKVEADRRVSATCLPVVAFRQAGLACAERQTPRGDTLKEWLLERVDKDPPWTPNTKARRHSGEACAGEVLAGRERGAVWF